MEEYIVHPLRLLRVVNESGFFVKPFTEEQMMEITEPNDADGYGVCEFAFANPEDAENFEKYLKRVLNAKTKVVENVVRIKVILEGWED